MIEASFLTLRTLRNLGDSVIPLKSLFTNRKLLRLSLSKTLNFFQQYVEVIDFELWPPYYCSITKL